MENLPHSKDMLKGIGKSMTADHKIGIMTVFLPRENLFFLREWLNYHLLIGFTHFYLYNNMGSHQIEYGNNPEINGKNKRGENVYAATAHLSDAHVQRDLDRLLAPYVAKGIVTQVIWQPRDAEGNVTFGIGKAYGHYIREFSAETDWTAVTDIDEFIVPVKHDNMQDLTAACEAEGYTYVTLPQKCFGPRFDEAGRPTPQVLRIIDACDWVTFSMGRKAFIRSDTLLTPDESHPFHVHTPLVDEARTRRVEDAGLARFNHYKFNQWEIEWTQQHIKADFQLDQQDTSMAEMAASTQVLDLESLGVKSPTPLRLSPEARSGVDNADAVSPEPNEVDISEDDLLSLYQELSNPTLQTHVSQAELQIDEDAASLTTVSPALSDEELLALYEELTTEDKLLLDHYPPVSCLCPTYARVDLLEESIQSFLLQDYPGEKELLIINDYMGQILHFDHPEVRIVNLPRAFHSLGEKMKAAVALAAHDLLFVWSDDDIYLPHRLRYSVERFDPAVGFFKADRAWFWNDGALNGPDRNVFHGGSCWSRELHHQVEGYPHTDLGCDQEFEKRIQLLRPNVELATPVEAEEIYYIYRWGGTGSYHLSNLCTLQAVAAHIERQADLGRVPQGEIQLRPDWKADYRDLVRTFLATGQAAQPEAARKPPPIPFPPPFLPIDPPQPPLTPARIHQILGNGGGPKISVILPTLNDSVLLKRTVEQFLDTVPQPSEIVVVDNGSSDGGSQFLAENCPTGVKFIQAGQPLGVSGARNRGLQEATGRIVVFSDAHMDVPTRWWEPIADLLDNPLVGVVGPGIGAMGNPDVPIAVGQRIADPELRVEWLLHDDDDEPRQVPTLGGGFMAMRRDVLEKAGAFDGDMPDWGSEDLELCLRYWLLGYEVWAAPSTKVLHYFRSSAPYTIRYEAVTQNVLHTAILHLSQQRLSRVFDALKPKPQFSQALAATGLAWQRRRELHAVRVRDDDWFFERFADTCHV